MFTQEEARARALILAFALHHFVAAVYRGEDGWYIASHVDERLIDCFLPRWAQDVECCEMGCGVQHGEWHRMERAEVVA